MSDHLYRAFGLTLASDGAIPSLAGTEMAADAPADVTIRHAAVALPPGAVAVDDMVVAGGADGLVIAVPESGTFAVTRDAILVDPDPAAGEAEVHAYLLGSAMGALLHLNGLLPLHCNAIAVDGGLCLLCGDSGAGKSTLAAYFESRGHAVLTDDICAVRRRPGGRFEGLPGIARLKLWQESLDVLALGDPDRKPVPWSEGKYELTRSNAPQAPVPVAAVYHLREAEEGRPAGIHRLDVLGALNALTANIYRRRLADLAGCAPAYLAAVAAIAGTIPAFTINRRWGLEHFAEEAEMIGRPMATAVTAR